VRRLLRAIDAHLGTPTNEWDRNHASLSLERQRH
jgi:hypothetical protein